MAIDEKTLGKDHPHLAKDFAKLAISYQTRGRWTEAASAYQNALIILKAKFPAGHPDIEPLEAEYDQVKKRLIAEQTE
jgi:hypothetical protein